MSVTVIQGSILNSPEDQIIIQQVNCQNAMGKGVAKAIYEKYPFVKEQYHKYCEGSFLPTQNKVPTPEELLGDVFYARDEDNTERRVACIFTQLNYRRYYESDGICYTDYKALRKALQSIATYQIGTETTFAIPWGLGAGLAGGDWNIIKETIEEELQAYNIVYYKI